MCTDKHIYAYMYTDKHTYIYIYTNEHIHKYIHILCIKYTYKTSIQNMRKQKIHGNIHAYIHIY